MTKLLRLLGQAACRLDRTEPQGGCRKTTDLPQSVGNNTQFQQVPGKGYSQPSIKCGICHFNSKKHHDLSFFCYMIINNKKTFQHSSCYIRPIPCSPAALWPGLATQPQQSLNSRTHQVLSSLLPGCRDYAHAPSPHHICVKQKHKKTYNWFPTQLQWKTSVSVIPILWKTDWNQ